MAPVKLPSSKFVKRYQSRRTLSSALRIPQSLRSYHLLRVPFSCSGAVQARRTHMCTGVQSRAVQGIAKASVSNTIERLRDLHHFA
jgi:hypothetical protein